MKPLSAEDFTAAAARAHAALKACRLCPRDCGVDRHAGPQGALCGLGSEGLVYKELLSHGEEALLCPTWLLDLGGCSMRCRFCSEWAHVVRPDARPAVPLDPAWFAATLHRRAAQGARTISFVGGDPTVSLYAILRALAAVPAEALLPIVWNCNGLIGEVAFAELEPLVDCWSIDLKFASERCAERLTLSDETHYRTHLETSLDRIHGAISPAGELPLPKLLIRHLLLPGHRQCCTLPLIERLAERWPRATVNLMTTYLPFGPAMAGDNTAPELRRMNAQEDKISAVAALRRALPGALIDGRPGPDSVPNRP